MKQLIKDFREAEATDKMLVILLLVMMLAGFYVVAESILYVFLQLINY